MEKRIGKLLSALETLGAKAMLLHSPANIRYFTGFTGEGVAFVADRAKVILTDSRYTEQAGKQSPGFEVRELNSEQFAETVATLARDHGSGGVGFEDEWLPVAQRNKIGGAMGGIGLIPTGNLCVRIRAVKDADEISLIRKACELTDYAFQFVLTVAKPGISEIELAAEIRYFLAKRYKALPAFEFIIASGANGSMPHAIATEREFCKGDLVTLDFGVDFGGYKTDMTRTFAMGRPSARMMEIYEIVREAQQAGFMAVKPGAACKDVDAVARNLIAGRGYGEYFGHTLGHGVGLEIHELPVLGARSDHVLEPGMIVTVEPGIYVPGVGGVRIEDTCLVTESGAESLFTSDKSLIIL